MLIPIEVYAFFYLQIITVQVIAIEEMTSNEGDDHPVKPHRYRHRQAVVAVAATLHRQRRRKRRRKRSRLQHCGRDRRSLRRYDNDNDSRGGDSSSAGQLKSPPELIIDSINGSSGDRRMQSS